MQASVGLIAGAAMGTALLFCHAFDFGIYATMSFGFSLVAGFTHRLGFKRLLLWWSEFVLPLVLFFQMSTGKAGEHIRYEAPFVLVKLFGIVKAFTSASLSGDIAFLVGAGCLLLLVVAYSRVKLAPMFAPGLLLLFVLYLVLPFELATGSYVDKRMPIAIAMLALAGLDIRIRHCKASSVLIGLIAVAFVLKQFALTSLWLSFDPLIDQIIATVDALPTGSILMQSECLPETSAKNSACNGTSHFGSRDFLRVARGEPVTYHLGHAVGAGDSYGLNRARSWLRLFLTDVSCELLCVLSVAGGISLFQGTVVLFEVSHSSS